MRKNKKKQVLIMSQIIFPKFNEKYIYNLGSNSAHSFSTDLNNFCKTFLFNVLTFLRFKKIKTRFQGFFCLW